MSEEEEEEEQYVTVRIPRFFDDLINRYIEEHQEEMRLLGQRPSRAGVVKKALYEFLKKEGIITGSASSLKVQGDVSESDDFLVHVKETFLAHTIISVAEGKTLPSDHLDLKLLEQHIRGYITKRVEQEGRKITKERLDELTKDILEYHQEMLKGLALMTRH